MFVAVGSELEERHDRMKLYCFLLVTDFVRLLPEARDPSPSHVSARLREGFIPRRCDKMTSVVGHRIRNPAAPLVPGPGVGARGRGRAYVPSNFELLQYLGRNP